MALCHQANDPLHVREMDGAASSDGRRANSRYLRDGVGSAQPGGHTVAITAVMSRQQRYYSKLSWSIRGCLHRCKPQDGVISNHSCTRRSRRHVRRTVLSEVSSGNGKRLKLFLSVLQTAISIITKMPFNYFLTTVFLTEASHATPAWSLQARQDCSENSTDVVHHLSLRSCPSRLSRT